MYFISTTQNPYETHIPLIPTAEAPSSVCAPYRLTNRTHKGADGILIVGYVNICMYLYVSPQVPYRKSQCKIEWCSKSRLLKIVPQRSCALRLWLNLLL